MTVSLDCITPRTQTHCCLMLNPSTAATTETFWCRNSFPACSGAWECWTWTWGPERRSIYGLKQSSYVRVSGKVYVPLMISPGLSHCICPRAGTFLRPHYNLHWWDWLHVQPQRDFRGTWGQPESQGRVTCADGWYNTNDTFFIHWLTHCKLIYQAVQYIYSIIQNSSHLWTVNRRNI